MTAQAVMFVQVAGGVPALGAIRQIEKSLMALVIDGTGVVPRPEGVVVMDGESGRQRQQEHP